MASPSQDWSEIKRKWNGERISQLVSSKSGRVSEIGERGFRWGERDDEKSSHLVLWDSISSLAAKLAQLVRVASAQAAVKPQHCTSAPAVLPSHLSQAFDSLLCLVSWATCTRFLWTIVFVCAFFFSLFLEDRLKERRSLPINPRSPAWCLRVLLLVLQLPKLECENLFIPQVKSTKSLQSSLLQQLFYLQTTEEPNFYTVQRNALKKNALSCCMHRMCWLKHNEASALPPKINLNLL